MPPNPPLNFSATSYVDKIKLTWVKPTGPEPTGYHMRFNGFPNILVMGTVGELSFTEYYPPDTTWSYEIRSFINEEVSAWVSLTASTLVPPAPTYEDRMLPILRTEVYNEALNGDERNPVSHASGEVWIGDDGFPNYPNALGSRPGSLYEPGPAVLWDWDNYYVDRPTFIRLSSAWAADWFLELDGSELAAAKSITITAEVQNRYLDPQDTLTPYFDLKMILHDWKGSQSYGDYNNASAEAVFRLPVDENNPWGVNTITWTIDTDWLRGTHGNDGNMDDFNQGYHWYATGDTQGSETFEDFLSQLLLSSSSIGLTLKQDTGALPYEVNVSKLSVTYVEGTVPDRPVNDDLDNSLPVDLIHTGDAYISPMIEQQHGTTEAPERWIKTNEQGVIVTASEANVFGLRTDQRSLWWIYKPQKSGLATFDTHLSPNADNGGLGGFQDTQIALWRSTHPTNPRFNIALVAFDQDNGPGYRSKMQDIPVVAGETYYLQVGHWSSTGVSHVVARVTGPRTVIYKALVWSSEGTKYQHGLDRGVLYPLEGPGVVWNGLVSVEDSHVGGEVEPLYVDGVRYRNLSSGRNYQATLTAYSAPEEFAPCNGELEVVNGLILTRQPRQRFGFSYRTLIGDGLGYKIHLVYNAIATPSSRGYRSLTNTPSPNTSSWVIDAVPVDSPAPRPTAHFVLDSTEIGSGPMEVIEGLLYGSENRGPYLPSIGSIAAIATQWDPQLIVPNYVSGVSTLTGGLGDVTEIDVDGVYILLPNGRLSEITISGLYQLTEQP